jgi:hypothetical protein
MATVKKAQYGDRITRRQEGRLGRISEKNPDKAKEVAERMRLRATRKKRGRELYKSLAPKEDLPAFKARTLEEARDNKKAQGGKVKSFPDLNKDGKITKADILKGRGVIAKKGAKIKKAQAGSKVAKYVSPYKSEKTADSTQYFKDKKEDINRASSEISRNFRPVTKGYMLDTARRNSIEREYDKERQKVMNDLYRQGVKGKPGFDKYGNPVSYKQASGSKKKDGGKVKKAQAGLTASNKRVGPIDPKGAWTKVQEMNLPPRNVKTSVSLKKDKQLGATKMMKMGGKAKAKKK